MPEHSFSRPDAAGLRKNAPLAVGLGGLACALAFALAGPQVARGLADDAGAMTFLLHEGGLRQPAARSTFVATSAPVAATRPRLHHAARPIVVAARHHRTVRLAVIAPPPVMTEAAAAVPVTPGSPPPSPLLDRTMRRGDALMTQAGIRVFRGASRYPYLVADFQPLARSADVAHRTELQAIDRAQRRQGWTAVYSPPAALQQPTITARAADATIPGTRLVGSAAVY
jgi:hypothetical protein